jgi:hypothetical protein
MRTAKGLRIEIEGNADARRLHEVLADGGGRQRSGSQARSCPASAWGREATVVECCADTRTRLCRDYDSSM